MSLQNNFYSGVLEKRGHIFTTWRSRYFELSGQILTYYTVATSTSGDVVKGTIKGKCTLNRFSRIDVYSDELEGPVARMRTSSVDARISEVIRNPSDAKTMLSQVNEARVKSLRNSSALSSPASSSTDDAIPGSSERPSDALAAATSSPTSVSPEKRSPSSPFGFYFTLSNVRMHDSTEFGELALAAESLDSQIAWITALSQVITNDIYRYTLSVYGPHNQPPLGIGGITDRSLLAFLPPNSSTSVGTLPVALEFPLELSFSSFPIDIIIPARQSEPAVTVSSIETLKQPPRLMCVDMKTSFVVTAHLRYTVLLINSDFRWSADLNPAGLGLIHWMVVNATVAPDCSLDCLSSSGAETVIEYVPPCPTYNSGPNRMFLVVFQQHAELTRAEISEKMVAFRRLQLQRHGLPEDHKGGHVLMTDDYRLRLVPWAVPQPPTTTEKKSIFVFSIATTSAKQANSTSPTAAGNAWPWQSPQPVQAVQWMRSALLFDPASVAGVNAFLVSHDAFSDVLHERIRLVPDRDFASPAQRGDPDASPNVELSVTQFQKIMDTLRAAEDDVLRLTGEIEKQREASLVTHEQLAAIIDRSAFLESAVETLEANLEAAKAETRNAQEAATVAIEELEKVRCELIASQEVVNERKAECAALVAASQSHESRIVALTTELSSAREVQEHSRVEINSLKEQLATSESQHLAQRAQWQARAEEASALQVQVAEQANSLLVSLQADRKRTAEAMAISQGLQQQLSDKTSALVASQQAVEYHAARIAEKQAEIDSLQRELSLAKDRLQDSSTTDALLRELDTNRQNLHDQSIELELRGHRIAELQALIDQQALVLEDEKGHSRRLRETKESMESLAAQRLSEIELLQSTQAETTSQVSTLSKRVHELEVLSATTKADLALYQQKLIEATSDLDSARTQCASQNQQVSDHLKRIESLSSSNAALERDLESLRNEHASTLSQFAKTLSQLATTTELLHETKAQQQADDENKIMSLQLSEAVTMQASSPHPPISDTSLDTAQLSSEASELRQLNEEIDKLRTQLIKSTDSADILRSQNDKLVEQIATLEQQMLESNRENRAAAAAAAQEIQTLRAAIQMGSNPSIPRNILDSDKLFLENNALKVRIREASEEHALEVKHLRDRISLLEGKGDPQLPSNESTDDTRRALEARVAQLEKALETAASQTAELAIASRQRQDNDAEVIEALRASEAGLSATNRELASALASSAAEIKRLAQETEELKGKHREMQAKLDAKDTELQTRARDSSTLRRQLEELSVTEPSHMQASSAAATSNFGSIDDSDNLNPLDDNCIRRPVGATSSMSSISSISSSRDGTSSSFVQSNSRPLSHAGLTSIHAHQLVAPTDSNVNAKEQLLQTIAASIKYSPILQGDWVSKKKSGELAFKYRRINVDLHLGMFLWAKKNDPAAPRKALKMDDIADVHVANVSEGHWFLRLKDGDVFELKTPQCQEWVSVLRQLMAAHHPVNDLL